MGVFLFRYFANIRSEGLKKETKWYTFMLQPLTMTRMRISSDSSSKLFKTRYILLSLSHKQKLRLTVKI